MIFVIVILDRSHYYPTAITTIITSITSIIVTNYNIAYVIGSRYLISSFKLFLILSQVLLYA